MRGTGNKYGITDGSVIELCFYIIAPIIPSYKTLLTNLRLVRKLVNLVISIKIVYNYNIFPNLSLTLLGTYSSSPISIRERKR